MIKVSVFYPHSGGSKFDMAYYVEKHMPMVRQKLGAACKGLAVEHGVGGATPGTPPTYVAMGHVLFDSVEAFRAAWAPHAEAILADIPNYTKIQPFFQVSEVKMWLRPPAAGLETLLSPSSPRPLRRIDPCFSRVLTFTSEPHSARDANPDRCVFGTGNHRWRSTKAKRSKMR